MQRLKAGTDRANGGCAAWVLAVFCWTALAAGMGAPGGTVTFPTINAFALDKQKIALPSGLEGQMNLLLLSFAADQQNQLDTWTATAQSLQHTNFGFRAYRLPVAERENALFRWWANASLRSEETDPELWHWVVPLYVDKRALQADLEIADDKSVVALLVDKGGHVVWRATGVSTAQTRAALMAAANSPH